MDRMNYVEYNAMLATKLKYAVRITLLAHVFMVFDALLFMTKNQTWDCCLPRNRVGWWQAHPKNHPILWVLYNLRFYRHFTIHLLFGPILHLVDQQTLPWRVAVATVAALVETVDEEASIPKVHPQFLILGYTHRISPGRTLYGKRKKTDPLCLIYRKLDHFKKI